MDLALPRFALPFLLFPGLLPLSLTGCSQGYSPNTYASAAAQQEATVQRGVIVGVRPVLISADGTIGAAAGGAVGGVAGAQVPGGAVTTTLGAVGGAVIGGLGGIAAEQAVADAKGWEYIVQETGGTLVSVTQTSKVELPIGLHVLVINGKQARIVPDYTVQIAAAAPTATVPAAAPAGQKPAVTNSTQTSATPNDSTATEVYVSPLLPAADVAAPLQVDPTTVPSNPILPPAPSPSAGSAAPPVQTPPVQTPPVPAPPGASSPTPPASSSSTATP